MAHPPETRAKVRAAYVYQRLTLEIAAIQSGVSLSSAQKWKTAAEKAGDDWDKARAAAGLSTGNVDELSRGILNDFLLQFAHTQELVAKDSGIDPLAKVQALASLSDSLAKMTANLRRLLPEINKAVVAQEVINMLAEFIQARFPEHLPVFVQILAPFGKELSGSIQKEKRK